MKKKYPVIGFTGAAGSGKDSAADILVGNHYNFIKLSFAKPLYSMLGSMLGLTEWELRDRKVKEAVLPFINKTPRELLQTLGTEWGRDTVSEDLWIKVLQLQLANIEKRVGVRGLVIPDVRFQNEVDFVHQLGGEVWKIERPKNPHAIQSGHASETAPLVGVNDIVANNGSLEVFKKRVLLKYVDYIGV